MNAPSDPGDATRLLRAWSEGKPGASDELLPIVYDELRRLARDYRRREHAARGVRAAGGALSPPVSRPASSDCFLPILGRIR